MEFKGTVKKIEDKGQNRYRLQIGKVWFSYFEKPKVTEGDTVNITYEENNMFKTIKEIKKLSTESLTETIQKQAMIKAASQFSKTPEECISNAKKLLKELQKDW